MNTLIFTIIAAVLVMILVVIGFAIGWFITGKVKMRRSCGSAVTKENKTEICSICGATKICEEKSDDL